jgi:hypothetical protein
MSRKETTEMDALCIVVDGEYLAGAKMVYKNLCEILAENGKKPPTFEEFIKDMMMVGCERVQVDLNHAMLKHMLDMLRGE